MRNVENHNSYIVLPEEVKSNLPDVVLPWFMPEEKESRASSVHVADNHTKGKLILCPVHERAVESCGTSGLQKLRAESGLVEMHSLLIINKKTSWTVRSCC